MPWKPLHSVLRDRKAEDRVAKESEALVGIGPVVDPRGVGDQLVDELVRQLLDEGDEGCGRRSRGSTADAELGDDEVHGVADGGDLGRLAPRGPGSP